MRSNSAWPASDVERFLRDTIIPARLGCQAGNGAPLVCSLWYLYDAGAIWCATQRHARLVEFLATDPGCAFEIAADAMPYRGVRGQGQAVISAAKGPEILDRLIDRYLADRGSKFAQWLLARSADEVAIRIEPDWVTSWDFSQRMQA